MHWLRLRGRNSLRPTFTSNIRFEARAAEIARRLGDTKAIEDARGRVAAFDPKTLNAVERFELADAYSDNGEWGKAADLLADLHKNDRPSELLNSHLYALYRANRRAEARAPLRISRSGSTAVERGAPPWCSYL